MQVKPTYTGYDSFLQFNSNSCLLFMFPAIYVTLGNKRHIQKEEKTNHFSVHLPKPEPLEATTGAAVTAWLSACIHKTTVMETLTRTVITKN